MTDAYHRVSAFELDFNAEFLQSLNDEFENVYNHINLTQSTLDVSAVVAGVYGDATHIPRLTLDAHGLILTISEIEIGTGDLTKADDTNVTLTLGGTPTNALFTDVSLTLGWVGTLSVARGGTGAGALTQGSVVFAGASGVYSEGNFFWDNSTDTLRVGDTPTISLILGGRYDAQSIDDAAAPLFVATNDAFRTVLMVQYGSAYGGTYAGVSFANLSVLEGSGDHFAISSLIGDLIFVDGTNEHLRIVNGTSEVLLRSLIAKYKDIDTVGWGVPAIYGTGRSTGQTAAVGTVATYTVGAADGTFEVSANVQVTTSTTHTIAVQVDYTDETNTARTLTLSFTQLAGAPILSITNATGTGPYHGIPQHIRCKTATAITVKTTGTFTTVTYNVEGLIKQVT